MSKNLWLLRAARSYWLREHAPSGISIRYIGSSTWSWASYYSRKNANKTAVAIW